jgi:hypothetical protein
MKHMTTLLVQITPAYSSMILLILIHFLELLLILLLLLLTS